jgi:hypothetical protein
VAGVPSVNDVASREPTMSTVGAGPNQFGGYQLTAVSRPPSRRSVRSPITRRLRPRRRCSFRRSGVVSARIYEPSRPRTGGRRPGGGRCPRPDPRLNELERRAGRLRGRALSAMADPHSRTHRRRRSDFTTSRVSAHARSTPLRRLASRSRLALLSSRAMPVPTSSRWQPGPRSGAPAPILAVRC